MGRPGKARPRGPRAWAERPLRWAPRKYSGDPQTAPSTVTSMVLGSRLGENAPPHPSRVQRGHRGPEHPAPGRRTPSPGARAAWELRHRGLAGTEACPSGPPELREDGLHETGARGDEDWFVPWPGRTGLSSETTPSSRGRETPAQGRGATDQPLPAQACGRARAQGPAPMSLLSPSLSPPGSSTRRARLRQVSGAPPAAPHTGLHGHPARPASARTPRAPLSMRSGRLLAGGRPSRHRWVVGSGGHASGHVACCSSTPRVTVTAKFRWARGRRHGHPGRGGPAVAGSCALQVPEGEAGDGLGRAPPQLSRPAWRGPASGGAGRDRASGGRGPGRGAGRGGTVPCAGRRWSSS